MEAKKLNDALKEKTKISILTFLMHGNKSYTQIMQELHEKDSGKINYHLKSLISLGLVEKNDEYGLTLEGERFTMYAKQFQLKEQYPIPVVCCEVVREDGSILLAKRAKKPYPNHWLLPGGKISHGESLFEASIREVKEECGIVIEPQEIVGSYPTQFKQNNETIHHVILFHIKAHFIKQENHIFEKNSDVSAYEWFKRSKINDILLVPSNKIFFKKQTSNNTIQELIIE
jgi:8-oxo-dGTP diphosphatase